jgi:predicted TIM-barrel fold metal-dependent hydrolase
MLWGSDWPHTVRTPGKGPLDVTPFKPEDDAHNLALMRRWIGDEAVFKQVLVDNPARLYRF